MNKTLTHLSSLMVLALTLSACSTVSTKNEVASNERSQAEKIAYADLFADRLIANTNPGGWMLSELVAHTLPVNRAAAVSIFRAAEIEAGLKAGSITEANYKSIFESENFKLNETQAADIIATSSFSRTFAEIKTNSGVMKQVSAIRGLNKPKVNTSGLDNVTAQNFIETSEIQLATTTQTKEVRKAYYSAAEASKGELKILNLEENPCATLNTSSTEGLSPQAAKNAIKVLQEESLAVKEVYSDPAVSNKKSCGIAWLSRAFVRPMLHDMNHVVNNIKEVANTASNSCKLLIKQAAAYIQGMSAAELATLKLQPAYQPGGYRALNECH